MAELMAKTNHPNPKLLDAYESWAEGGWGCILTGHHFHPKRRRVKLTLA